MDREALLIKAMTYNSPEEIPIAFSILPAARMKRSSEIQSLAERYPHFLASQSESISYQMPPTYHVGIHRDEWGCEWSNIEEGMEAIVTGHPVKTREDILSLQIPANRDGRLPHGFMYLRLLDLRGFEEAMLDFAEECPELQILIDKVTEYNCIQTEIVLEKAGPVLYYGDDLGMQKGLAIGPEKWRRYLKPSFTKIYGIARRAGKYVYMHTDGMIYEIIPDLFDAGVQMVNPQYRANGLENLAEVCKGRYPLCLDLDRQFMPFATPAACKEHLRECVEALYLPEGGLGLQIEIGSDVPPENIEAFLQAADALRFYKGGI